MLSVSVSTLRVGSLAALACASRIAIASLGACVPAACCRARPRAAAPARVPTRPSRAQTKHLTRVEVHGQLLLTRRRGSRDRAGLHLIHHRARWLAAASRVSGSAGRCFDTVRRLARAQVLPIFVVWCRWWTERCDIAAGSAEAAQGISTTRLPRRRGRAPSPSFNRRSGRLTCENACTVVVPTTPPRLSSRAPKSLVARQQARW